MGSRVDKNRKGFTLIELLVVIVIIGILTSLGVLNYQKTNQKARDARRKTDLEQVRTALEISRSDSATSVYPDALGALVPDYIQKLPDDPKDYIYVYEPAVDQRSYNLCAYLEVGDEDLGVCGGSEDCGGAVCNYQVTNP